MKNKLFVLIGMLTISFLGANSAFAQCGADGTQPCNTTPKKTPTKKTTTKKTTTNPTVTKPTNTSKKTQTVVAKSETKFVPTVPKFEMVQIAAGSFMMGSTNAEIDQAWAKCYQATRGSWNPCERKTFENELPQHKVIISRNFWIGKYEVTQAQWQAVMGNNPSYHKICGGNCPVESVSWDDVQEFVQKLNRMQSEYKYRLPTEAEWEYAARAGTTGDYYDNLDSKSWIRSTPGDIGIHQVGGKQANAFGLYDMIGNVGEWVADLYGSYPNETVTDPAGPNFGSDRILRGGNYVTSDFNARSATRSYTNSSIRDLSLGFRLVRD